MTTASKPDSPTWRASSYSGTNGGNCIEVAECVSGALPVRDSKNLTGPVLAFPTPAWSSFIATLKGDIPPS